MDIFRALDKCKGDDVVDPRKQGQTDTPVQLVISLAIGLSSFIAFCVGGIAKRIIKLYYLLTAADTSATMEEAICGTKTTD
jgi:hypothetical protein